MSIFRDVPPTAGFPIYFKDMLSLVRPDIKSPTLEDDFKAFLGVRHARVTPSGTAALYIILETLKGMSNKKTVVIPSFTCPLVPLAIKKSGLKVVISDVTKDALSFEPEKLRQICVDNNDILAIIATHLGGIPADMASSEDVSKKNGIFLIEDCAQSLGAVYKGRKVGTVGDFSFFSLAPGKGPTICEGGIAVANRKEYIGMLDGKIDGLLKNDLLEEAFKALELFGYWVFYRPQLFWFVFRLPAMFWESRGDRLRSVSEVFSADFPLNRVSRARCRVGHSVFKRVGGSISRQREKAFFYMKLLAGLKGVNVVGQRPGDMASYPYLILIFDSSEVRDKILAALKYTGLGVSIMFYCAINDYPCLADIVFSSNYSAGKNFAASSMTLSTSDFITEAEMTKTAQLIKNMLSQ